MKTLIYSLIFFICLYGIILGKEKCQIDVIKTSIGVLKIHFIGHGTLMFEINDMVIHIDPFGRLYDYNKLPDADIILITHHHSDHFDVEAIKKIQKENTVIIYTKKCSKVLEGGKVLHNGDRIEVSGIKIEAVPAYNIVNKRDNGEPFHPKGEGNGYVLNIGDKRVYIAGDTENIPEMKVLKNIYIAFLPMNLPYTMTPEMVADAAKSFKPKILYPYHYGDTDPQKLLDLLKDEKRIEVRIRNMR
ncbi:MAG: MBL fold metallo-hydrolase [Candidatus Marinimicrobia bacterium]|nr:MBL fold metallo-hydrolase [Candidatus Neomarinimicrobiota bacterium]